MANLTKIKQRFGNPPEAAATDNLRQPEEAVQWVDGRSLRAKGRTSQLATRILPEIHLRLKLRAVAERTTIAELIERCFLEYEAGADRTGSPQRGEKGSG